MKKLLIASMLAMVIVPAYAQHNTTVPQANYTISGKCSPTAKWVYLLDPTSRSTKVDSVQTVNGTFKMNGTDAKDYFLTLSDGENYAVFINDGTPISADLVSSTIKGSALNNKLNGYYRLHGELSQKQRALVDPIIEAQKNGATDEDLQAMVESVRSQLDEMDKSEEALMRRILTENSDNVIPAYYSQGMVYMFELEELEQFFSPDKAYYNHPMTSRIRKYIDGEKKKRAIIGQQFIDIEEADTAGVTHKLSEYCGKGDYVLIDFWASWCGPCMAEMPNVKANYEKYKGKNFNIVGLSFDQNKERWVKCIKENELNWVHLSDLKYWETIAASTYNVNGIPYSLLVDPEGKVIASNLRGEALGKKLAEIFGF